MDMTKVAIATMMAIVSLVGLFLGYRFADDHWEDIRELATIAIVLGGGFSLAAGGWAIRSGR